MIELLLNTCFNCNDVSIVNEACNIIENIACIPGIYDYEKLNNSNKNFILNKELPFDFIANEDESFFFNNIIYIMKNSLGNVNIYIFINIFKNLFINKNMKRYYYYYYYYYYFLILL